MDLGEQPEMNPNQSFRGENQSQFPSQYPYPPSTSAFAMDQDMSMNADHFAATVQAHANASLDTSASGPSQSAHNMNTSPTSAAAPGMAPPQNANHPYSPDGGRPSIDETQDGGLSGGDPKRKRSKVSRACDECRRKKVRCDAAADDGTIKTCSNCARAGLTCEYSRVPMKRGPSKGYIKELSERVQQVESLQLALSNTPGYRPSLDATGGVYAEQPYSPDDPMSLKRNFSFSADQRSPFVGPEYHRDRIPSVGGWNSSSPHSSSFRARDRGSIAIAPDQQPNSTVSFAKPFWSQEPEGLPPAKRQKMDVDSMAKPEIGQEFLSKYYSEFHDYLPVLPDADTAMAIIEKASTKVQHAFIAAVRHLPSTKKSPRNGSSVEADVTKATSNPFDTRQDLEEFMWSAARELPESRSTEDNLLYLWTYILMAVEAENDLTRLHDGNLPRTVLIKQAVDLGWSCVTALSSGRTSIDDKPPYLVDFARAWHCATVPARLHALAVGSSNPIPRYYMQYFQKHVPPIPDVLSGNGIITALGAAQLTVVATVVQDNLPPCDWGRNLDMQHRLSIQETFDYTIAARPEAAANKSFVEHLRLFVDLTLSRYTMNFHPSDIVIPAAALAEALRKHLTASDGSFVYNPFHLHFFTLATITLLEFLSEPQETELYRVANAGTEDIKVALEQISEQDHMEDEQQQSSDKMQTTEQTRKPIHWADALLKMLDERVKNISAAQANGTSNAGSNGSGGPRLGDGSSAAVDFSLLLRHGYLTVLAQQIV